MVDKPPARAETGSGAEISEDTPTGYTETPEERERLLMLYEPDVRAVIEAFMTEHGVTAREASTPRCRYGSTGREGDSRFWCHTGRVLNVHRSPLERLW